MSIRLISRLDVKMSHLIKGVQMEGWRKVGNPTDRAKKYYEEGIDEIIYIDVVASLYQRNNLIDIVRNVAKKIFIPITVGGGISDLVAAKKLMEVGADKLAINTAATHRPTFLSELVDTFGSQAVVLNIEAKSLSNGRWTVMTDNGRNHTGLDAVDWATKAYSLGVGEILITSIDKDGTKKGMELNLVSAISNKVNIPVILSGGCGTTEHASEAISSGADAIAIGAALHSDHLSIKTLRSDLRTLDFKLRPIPDNFQDYE